MKNKKGFTLIELLVVIAIIGLLSTLSILALNSARARARDAKRISDIKQVQTALEMYYNDNAQYPATADVTFDGASSLATNSIIYMAKLPAAPIPPDGTCTTSNNPYTYTATTLGGSSAGSYTLTYCLGSATGGLSAGVATATPAGIKE